MEDTRHEIQQPTNHTLFPMAVGAVFLLALVLGAILG